MQEPSSVTTQHNTTAKGGDGGGLRLRLRLRDGQRGAAAAGRKTGEGEAAQAQKASDGWNVDEEARGSASVFERFARFEDGLASCHTRSLDHVLVVTADGLDFEPTGNQLNGLFRFICNSNVVGKTVLVQR